MERKKVLIVSQEMDPYLVLSEIGNVVKKIVPYVHDNGLEVRVLMPRFGVINERRNRLHEVVRLSGINIIINDEDHPLIIKVASLPGARIQIYFLDNDDFFKRKMVFRDEEGKYFDDNIDRMLFFSRGVIETVRKFGWAPDIIHCHGWMSSLIPLFTKTTYLKDPIFSDTKTIFSVYGVEFEEKLNDIFLEKVKISEDIPDEAIEQLSGLDYSSLIKSAITYSDAVVWAMPNLDQREELESFSESKDTLEIEKDIDIAPLYLEYYNKLLGL
ncbi:MAG: glycogen/starch synthase [Chitinophagales bacterium]|nr:glycogen/starch synthase [Chitinophagales bacterium]